MSKSKTYSFGSIPTLSTINWTSDKLIQSWKWKDRSMDYVMQRFIDLNSKNLSYLGISVHVAIVYGKPALQLTTSNYIGTIPIKSPMNGKVVGDLTVVGRYGEDVGELISLLDDEISPEYSDEFKLTQDSQMTPPIFIECCKYIDTYIEAAEYKWRKFSNVIKREHQPKSSTLWGEYAQRVAKNPLEFNTFKNKCNTLTTEHEEWHQLNYILSIAIEELSSIRAPRRTRAEYSEKISRLKNKLIGQTYNPINKICVRMSDPIIIKRLKEIAISILNNKANTKLAWRLDYTTFFESYVQFICTSVAKQKGARNINNPHYSVSMIHKPTWTLSYLEPDVVIQKEGLQVVVDAKYKSHMFNLNETSDDLKDTFRHDLHQILAYCSFNVMQTKKAMLIYPFKDFIYRKMTIESPITHSDADVYLVGIPMVRNKMYEVKEQLCNLLDD